MTIWSLAPLVLAALFPLAVVIGQRRRHSVQPLRLEMARRGETLLLRRDISDGERQHITSMLNSAFGRAPVLWCLLLLMPLFAIVALFSRRFRKNLVKANFREGSPIASEHRELRALHLAIMRANHPALFPAVEVAMIVLLVPVLELARHFDSAIPREMSLDEDRLVCMVDHHKAHLHLRTA